VQQRNTRTEATRELPRPGPVGLAVRVMLGAFVIYSFVALFTKWNVFVERDPIESGRFYTLATVVLLPYLFDLTFRRRWGLWPAIVFVAGGAALGLAGWMVSGEFWNLVLAGWVYAGDLLVFAALAISFPVAIATRSPGCELGAIPWILARRRGATYEVLRPGCAVGLDYLDRWEARWWRRVSRRPVHEHGQITDG
jgi:hypothetical protein